MNEELLGLPVSIKYQEAIVLELSAESNETQFNQFYVSEPALVVNG